MSDAVKNPDLVNSVPLRVLPLWIRDRPQASTPPVEVDDAVSHTEAVRLFIARNNLSPTAFRCVSGYDTAFKRSSIEKNVVAHPFIEALVYAYVFPLSPLSSLCNPD